LDSNLRSRLDIREDPQLKEKYPQPIPRISKVVGSLQAYGEIEKYLTYDLIKKERFFKASNL
jgi:hypothetical protein